jgi:hypothetical protein
MLSVTLLLLQIRTAVVMQIIVLGDYSSCDDVEDGSKKSHSVAPFICLDDSFDKS